MATGNAPIPPGATIIASVASDRTLNAAPSPSPDVAESAENPTYISSRYMDHINTECNRNAHLFFKCMIEVKTSLSPI